MQYHSVVNRFAIYSLVHECQGVLTANDLELVTVTNWMDVYGVRPPPRAPHLRRGGILTQM